MHLEHICCAKDATPLLHWDSQTERKRVHTLPFVIKADDAAFQRCCSWPFQCCHGERISFCPAFLHQRLRDRSDKADVDSNTEADFMKICIGSVERWRLAQASQVLDQTKSASRGSTIGKHYASPRISSSSRHRLRYHVRLQDDKMTFLVPEKSLFS